MLRWVDTGRQVLSDLMSRSDKDPKDFAAAYDSLVEYLAVPVREKFDFFGCKSHFMYNKTIIICNISQIYVAKSYLLNLQGLTN